MDRKAVFDSNFLLPFLEPTAGAPIERAHERIVHLVKNLDDDGDKILIPAIVVSEVLVHAGEAEKE